MTIHDLLIIVLIAILIYIIIKTMTKKKQERRNRFEEIVFGSEFNPNDQRIHRWENMKNVRVGIQGTYPLNAIDDIQNIISQINNVLQGNPFKVIFVEKDGYPFDITIFYETPPIPDNDGVFLIHLGKNQEIKKATIYISPNISKKAQRALVAEEMYQSFGLMQDTYHDPTSLFYQGWTLTDRANSDDRAFLKRLYQDNQIYSGMSKTDFYSS